MKQAARFDGFLFDPFSVFQNGLTAPRVDIGEREILQALVIATVIVVIDEGVDLLSEIARQVVVFQQNAVLERLVPHAASSRLRRDADLSMTLEMPRGGGPDQKYMACANF